MELHQNIILSDTCSQVTVSMLEPTVSLLRSYSISVLQHIDDDVVDDLKPMLLQNLKPAARANIAVLNLQLHVRLNQLDVLKRLLSLQRRHSSPDSGKANKPATCECGDCHSALSCRCEQEDCPWWDQPPVLSSMTSLTLSKVVGPMTSAVTDPTIVS